MILLFFQLVYKIIIFLFGYIGVFYYLLFVILFQLNGKELEYIGYNLESGEEDRGGEYRVVWL